jgi:hypothetical protein
MEWLVLIGFLVLAGWGIDRHLRLRDIEIALKDHLSDLETASPLTKTCECCLQSRIMEIKHLIREHFKL